MKIFVNFRTSFPILIISLAHESITFTTMTFLHAADCSHLAAVKTYRSPDELLEYNPEKKLITTHFLRK